MSKELDVKQNKIPKLSDFPPDLRKLATHILNSYDKPVTIKEACLQLGLDYRVIRNKKARYNVKHGRDLDLYIYNQRLKPIKDNAFQIYASVAQEAIAGKLGQQKLVAELLGDVKDRMEIDHRITGLFAVVSPASSPQIPSDIQEHRDQIKPEGEQIIDVEYED